MSIRLLQAVAIAGVHTAVDGKTLFLAGNIESDLVGSGRAEWVTPPAMRTALTDHVRDHLAIGRFPPKTMARAPVPLFGGENMLASDVTIVSGSPELTVETDPSGRKRLKVVTGAGVAAQLSFSGLVNAYFGGDAYVALRGSYEDGLSAMSMYFAPGATIATNYVLSGAINFAAAVESPYLQQGGANETFTWRTGKKNNSITGSITYPFVAGSHKLVITPRGGMVATVYIYAVGVGAKNPKGRCVVMADDGLASWFALGAPLFNEVGIPTTGGIIASAVGLSAAYGGLDKWKAYANAGNAVIAHGPNSGSYSGNLITNLATDAERVADMEKSRDLIQKHGMQSPFFDHLYAWPQGAFQASAGDTALLEAAYRAGFSVARCSSVINPLVQYNMDAATRLQRLALPNSTHGWAGTTAGQVALTTALADAITAAATYGTDIFVTFHDVVIDSTADGSMDSTKIRVADLLTIRTAITNAVAAGTLECVTLPELAYKSAGDFWSTL